MQLAVIETTTRLVIPVAVPAVAFAGETMVPDNLTEATTIPFAVARSMARLEALSRAVVDESRWLASLMPA